MVLLVTDWRSWPSQSHMLVFLPSGLQTPARPPPPRITHRTLGTAVEGALFSGGPSPCPASPGVDLVG